MQKANVINNNYRKIESNAESKRKKKLQEESNAESERNQQQLQIESNAESKR